MEQETETEAAVCRHHWVIESKKALRLSREVVMKHPNCIGRESRCKKCGAEKIHLEKVWDHTWKD